MNVFEIDKVPGCYTKVTKLNLSYNRLSHLDGLTQFKFLTHLHLSHNIIEDIKELEKVTKKEQLVVLSLNNNPVADHPDLLTLAVIIFPRLVELNGVKLSDHTRQDIFDSIELGKQLILYLCKNEILIQGFDKEIAKIKENYRNIQMGKNRPLSEVQQSSDDLRSGKPQKKGFNLPKLPVFTYHSKIRPYMIIDYIELIGKAAHYYMSDESEAEMKERVFKWLFCEVLLNLNSWGNHALQKFLQKNASDPDIETSFSKQLLFFQSLKFKLKFKHQFSDIFPSESLKDQSRICMFESYLETTENWSVFPVFSGNSDYLKAILTVLQTQMQLIEELQREKEELLSFDTTVLNVPGFVEKFNEGNRATSYDFSLDLRASSRTTVKRFGSPLNACVSPQDLKDSNEFTDEKRKFKIELSEVDETQENLEQMRLLEMQKEVEREKGQLEKRLIEIEEREKKIREAEEGEKRLKDMEEKDKRVKDLEEIERRAKEIAEEMEKCRKKMHVMVCKGTDKLGKVMEGKMRNGFMDIKQFVEGQTSEKLEAIEKAEEYHRKKIMKKYFDPLRYFQILYKAKRMKANEYYAGRVLLDSFFSWKNFYCVSKQDKKLQHEAKVLAKMKKQKESQDFKKSIEKFLRRLTDNEKTIKKLWKMMKTHKNIQKADCFCGGFKCQVCVKEKSLFIRSELKYLKSKISKAHRSHSINT